MPPHRNPLRVGPGESATTKPACAARTGDSASYPEGNLAAWSTIPHCTFSSATKATLR